MPPKKAEKATVVIPAVVVAAVVAADTEPVAVPPPAYDAAAIAQILERLTKLENEHSVMSRHFYGCVFDAGIVRVDAPDTCGILENRVTKLEYEQVCFLVFVACKLVSYCML